MSRSFTVWLWTLVLLIPIAASGQSQNITTPAQSPAASVSQEIGMSDITISYHRPAVKDREVWGALVPYNDGKPMPWRAGANENTTISFSSDVLLNGQRLGAGTYGLHMIPTADMWTVIFSRNHTSWGSFFYKPEEDALRIQVKPVTAPQEEWLMYGFEDIEPLAATAYLRWEKLKVPFRVELADGQESIVRSLSEQLENLPGFFPAGHVAAAQYCVNNNVALDQALVWADRAIQLGGGFNAQMVKSQVLEKTGKATEAKEIRDGALTQASENELNNYGYQILNQGKKAEAVEIFRENVKRHPDSWNAYDSLGEGLDANGETKSAIDYYKKALEKNPPEAQVQRINGVLKTLETKM